jgi:fructokinase
MPFAQVYYFDRVSRAGLEFAKVQRSRGALIMFEPCRFNTDSLFKRCLDIAHIVKYSSEHEDDKTLKRKIPLEIQTLGSEGLRYRMGSVTREHAWQKLHAYRVRELVDSAGAGDWCSAGAVHLLGRNGAAGFREASREDVENALRFGQRLAALDCSYEGARGPMYNLSKTEFESLVQKLILEENFEVLLPRVPRETQRRVSMFMCPSCPHELTRCSSASI